MLLRHKLLLVALILVAAHCGQISSWNTKISYNFDGQTLGYKLYFSLESGLGATDYLRILWPEAIHTATDKTKILVTLISD